MIELKKIAQIITVLIISVLISFGVEKLMEIPEHATVLENNWHLYSPQNNKILELPNRFRLKEVDNKNLTEGIYSLKSYVYISDTIKNPTFIIQQPPDHGYRIYIDNKFMLESGDMVNGNALLWKEQQVIKLGDELSSGWHKVTFEIYINGLLEFLSSPYIVDSRTYSFKYFFSYIFNRYLPSFIMGIVFVIGVIFISMLFFLPKKDLSMTILGFSMIFWAINFLDFLTFDNTFIPYLLFRKITSGAFVVGFLLNVVFLYSQLFFKISKRIVLIFGTYTLILLGINFYPASEVVFNSVHTGVNIACFIFFLPFFFSNKIFERKGSSTNFIQGGVFAASFFAFRYMYYEFVDSSYVVLAHVGIFIYLISICIFFILEYVNKQNQLITQTSRADHFFNKSVKDPLTGVNNRHILDFIDFSNLNYSLFICDLDDFKNINDSYGHKFGDEVLRDLANNIKSVIRDTDYIIRFGGDEFVFILENCPEKKSVDIAYQIWNKITESIIETDNKPVKYSCSAGGTISKPREKFDDVLKRADSLLYLVKKSSKGTFNFSG